MTLLNVLGITSFLFALWFTHHAYYANPTAGQTPRDSILEAWTNIGWGFLVNYGANLLLLPLVGANMTLGQNFALGWIYTAISMIRQFVIRRKFNQKLKGSHVKT